MVGEWFLPASFFSSAGPAAPPSNYVSEAAFARLDALKVRAGDLRTGVNELLARYDSLPDNLLKNLALIAIFHTVGGFSFASVTCSIGALWAALGVFGVLLCAAIPIYGIAWRHLLGAYSQVLSLRRERKEVVEGITSLVDHVNYVGLHIYTEASPLLAQVGPSLECPGTPSRDRVRFDREKDALLADLDEDMGRLTFHRLYFAFMLAFSVAGVLYTTYMMWTVYTSVCPGDVNPPAADTTPTYDPNGNRATAVLRWLAYSFSLQL